MFDSLRNAYRLRCPLSGERVWITVSSFRTIKRLRGATHPAVFRVQFDCTCGTRHESLLAHDRLDWSPLGTETSETFVNLLTGTRELVASELGALATSMLRAGKWPWSFWCHPESSMRPGFPSSLRMVTPDHGYGDERLGVLVRCFSCARHTVNIVSREHLDVPYHHDARIGFVDRVFDGDSLTVEERFRHQLEYGHLKSEWLRDAG